MEAAKSPEPSYSTTLTAKPVVSFVEPKPTIEVPTLPVATTSMKPPKHRNPELEKKLSESKAYTKLNLKSMSLTNEDMEIMTYYILANNMVSTINFGAYSFSVRKVFN